MKMLEGCGWGGGGVVKFCVCARGLKKIGEVKGRT